MELNVVTFEQAKKLKELGFPQETDSWYYYDIEGKCVPHLQKGGHKEYCCDAPSLELVNKWLRDEKQIFLYVEPYFPDMDNANIRFAVKHYKGYSTATYFYKHKHKTYEEALSAIIDKFLNNEIKI